MTRFYFLDPLALTGALQQPLGEPAGRLPQEAQLIPVDVYREADSIVIEGALPGARLEDVEITSEGGLLTVRAAILGGDRDFAIREIPRGPLSRSLALPADAQVEEAKATYQDGILRIVIPRTPAPTGRTIRVELGSRPDDSARIVMDRRTEPGQIVDAVEGQDYREIDGRRKRRPSRAR